MSKRRLGWAVLAGLAVAAAPAAALAGVPNISLPPAEDSALVIPVGHYPGHYGGGQYGGGYHGGKYYGGGHHGGQYYGGHYKRCHYVYEKHCGHDRYYSYQKCWYDKVCKYY
jgi:hypothetical protein